MTQANTTYDLLVIGGGPAGYVGAIRAAQLGLNVACIEREHLGGVCLNWGCIPTKALLAQAELYQRIQHADDWGIEVADVRVNWPKVIERSRTVAGNLNKGVQFLFKKNKVAHLSGHAKIIAPGPDCQVELRDKPDGAVQQTLNAKNILVCTGAGPRELPFAPFDGDKIIHYKQAMSLPEQPTAIVIIGAGAIGMEFAYFFNAFGVKVTVIEMLDRLLPIEDADVSKAIAKAYRKQGVASHTSVKTLAVNKTTQGVEVVYAPVDDESKTATVNADKALVAVGVAGRFDGLFDDSLGLKIERGHIHVNKTNYQTSLPNIYAAGDVIGPPWLAHVASEEAVVAVERVAGHHPTPIDYEAIPGCTYCQPQVASLGKTEQALTAAGLQAGEDYRVGQFPFQASGKAQAVGHTEGFVKLITDAKHGEILGVHMIGENVTELLAEMGLAKRLEATGADIIATMHAHPTLSEAIHEAALGADGRTIHF